jgi:hypothetical protein
MASPKQRVQLVLDYCGYKFLAVTNKIRKDIFLYKVGLPTTTGLVQQPVQIVVRYRSHNLTLFVRRCNSIDALRTSAHPMVSAPYRVARNKS